MRKSLVAAIVFFVLLVGVVVAGVALQRRGSVASTGCVVQSAAPHLELSLNGTANASSIRFDVAIVDPTDEPLHVNGTEGSGTWYLVGYGGRLLPLTSFTQEAMYVAGYNGTDVPAHGKMMLSPQDADPHSLRARVGGDPAGDYLLVVFASGLCGEGRARVG